MVPNDPWTVRAWSSSIDPEHRLIFLADGNLELARWLGATFLTEPSLQFGARSRGYLAMVDAGRIERLTLDEPDRMLASHSDPSDAEHRRLA
ncbi:hypothetical protein JNW90_34495 [Micromonospora sp. STR1s_5]|nr:hypothetical protein [Micromonospora sp. STR1s_5]